MFFGSIINFKVAANKKAVTALHYGIYQGNINMKCGKDNTFYHKTLYANSISKRSIHHQMLLRDDTYSAVLITQKHNSRGTYYTKPQLLDF
jgi:hypothetical protein